MSAAALRIYGIRNPVTVKDAEESEEDYIMLWQHGQDTMQFYKQLGEHHNQIKALTRHHLQLRKETITIAPSEEWIHGTFNLCVPIEVNYGYACRKFMFRCPMPHKNAEAQYEGTVEEKMGCELGAYVWIQEKCPNIRIPYLYGFGFGSGSYYTHEMQRPWYIRFPHVIRRHLHRLLRRPVLSRYIRHPIADIDFPLSYMLIEFISPSIGQMLSQTWDKHRNDPSRRSKLFQSISRIILSLARVPQLSIGSYRFNESGVITLTNRPLTSSIVALENEGAKRIIQSNQVYHSTEDFVTDTLKLHDNAFIQNPNGACDDKECRSLMAATTMLRTISHDYIEQKHRNGPYFLQFTDLTRSNVFVDDDWNITCLLDLEWISALPREMISVPHWLSGCDLIDGFTGKEFAKFSVVRLEFMHQFELEEDKMEMEHDISLTATINDIWNSQRVWFWYTMNTGSITLYPIVKTYIYSKFPEADIAKNEKCFSALWRPDAGDIMRKKRKDYKGYICHFTKLVEEHGEVPSLRS